jgi:hypothetical protein
VGSSRLRDAYLAEGLVFQALQAELGGSVRREVRLAGVHVDGLIHSADGAITIVETKIILNPRDWARRLRDAKDQLERARSALADEKSVRLLLAVVVDGNLGRVAEVKSQIPTSSGLEIRVYGLSELIERYGFGDSEGR